MNQAILACSETGTFDDFLYIDFCDISRLIDHLNNKVRRHSGHPDYDLFLTIYGTVL